METIEHAGALYHSGEWPKAEQICRQTLAAGGEHGEALRLLAIITARTRRIAEAAQLLERALEVGPDDPTTHNNYGNVLRELKRPGEALRCYERALQIKPDYAEARYNQGNALRELGRHDEALGSYQRAIELRPAYAAAYYNSGLTLHELGRLPNALACFELALQIKPDLHAALHNRAVVLQQMGRFADALESQQQALQIKPDVAEAWHGRGNALHALGRLQEALASYERALEINPRYPEALYNRGVTLHELGRATEAIESYNRSLELRPRYPAALYNRGLALHRLKRFTDALESYDRALGIKPDYFEVYNNRGNTLQELRRTSEALNSYNHALRLNPLSAEAYCNQGNVLQDLRHCEEALQCYERALQLEPDFAAAHYNRGNTLRELERFAEASDSYARTLQLQPKHHWAYGNWLHAKGRECRWNQLSAQITELLARIEQGQPVSPPLFLLALTDTPAQQRHAAEIWVREICPPSLALPGIPRGGRDARIRLGYYSADFHSHATAHLAAGLFEEHDRERFHVVAFSFGPDVREDPMRKRLSEAFDEFVTVRTMSDLEVAQLSRDLGIDIAVDLKGFTLDERTRIFAHRAAPVQVSYLGYPGTMGAPYIDYLIADPVLIPEGSRQHYSEKIAYLPHSYQVNDRQRPIAERPFARAELGLPAQGFVFCCFNNAYKITPGTFTAWMRILASVPGSVLWLLQDSPGAAENLRREAQARGVDAARLVFAGRMPLPEHLARHRVADLFLDNLPYNAHTTASDALWAGLPVLTCLGESFAGRVAGSLLNAVGLPELVTTTLEQYEALAIELATQAQRLGALRTRLAGNRLRAPLFDTALFTRHLENAYLQMYQRHQRGLPPEHLFVEA